MNDPVKTNPVDEELLRSTTRADVWATEFAKVFPNIDKATMIGWFANCAQNAIDHERRAPAPLFLVALEQAIPLRDGGRPFLAYGWPAEFPAFRSREEARAFMHKDGEMPLGWVTKEVTLPPPPKATPASPPPASPPPPAPPPAPEPAPEPAPPQPPAPTP